MTLDFSLGVFVVLLVILAWASMRIYREYERGVVFTLGRFWKKRAGNGHGASRYSAGGRGTLQSKNHAFGV
jgi:regulator of protease activity HflC (stomatin/prohibitin superfamily)